MIASQGVKSTAQATTAMATTQLKLIDARVTDKMTLDEYTQRQVMELVSQATDAYAGAAALGQTVDSGKIKQIKETLDDAAAVHTKLFQKHMASKMQFFFHFHTGPGPNADVSGICILALIAKSLGMLTGGRHWGQVSVLLEHAAAFCSAHGKEVDMDTHLNEYIALVDSCHGMIQSATECNSSPDAAEYEQVVKTLLTTFGSKAGMVEEHIHNATMNCLKKDLHNINKCGCDFMPKLPIKTAEACRTAEILATLPRVSPSSQMVQAEVAGYVVIMNQVDTLDVAVAKELYTDIEGALLSMRDFGINGVGKFVDKIHANTEAVIAARDKFTPVLAATAKWDFSQVQWMFADDGGQMYTHSYPHLTGYLNKF